MKKPETSERPIEKVLNSARESFIKANGYIPTEEDALRLTAEARAEIRAEKEKANKNIRH